MSPADVLRLLLALALVALGPLVLLLVLDAFFPGSWIERFRARRGVRQDRQRAVQSLRRLAGSGLLTKLADLPRLRREAATDPQAYDQALIEICDLLQVPHALGPEVTGMDRDIERVRLEALLQAAGVRLQEPE